MNLALIHQGQLFCCAVTQSGSEWLDIDDWV